METIPDFGLGWLDGAGPAADVVISTRVRLARNLQGRPYVSRAGREDREAVLDAVARVVRQGSLPREAVFRSIEEIGPQAGRILLERRLVSQELLGGRGARPPAGAAVAVSSLDPVSVMINEEDHLRMQCLVSGLRFAEAWELVDELDDEIGERLPFAYHHEFGYLTACPTNAGTGLRASALVHLPGLAATRSLRAALRGVVACGLTYRGLHGEGSGVVGNFVQISNQTTLGKSEADLLDHLGQLVETLIGKERNAREVLVRDAATVIEDKVWRAYGTLRYARTLSYEELVNHLAGVRLGVSLKLLPTPSVYTLNKLMIFSQAAHLDQAAGRELSTPERHEHRAEYVRRAVESESGQGEKGGGTSGSGA